MQNPRIPRINHYKVIGKAPHNIMSTPIVDDSQQPSDGPQRATTSPLSSITDSQLSTASPQPSSIVSQHSTTHPQSPTTLSDPPSTDPHLLAADYQPVANGPQPTSDPKCGIDPQGAGIDSKLLPNLQTPINALSRSGVEHTLLAASG